MNKLKKLVLVTGFSGFLSSSAFCAATTTTIRDASEYILKKFGRGSIGQTVDEVAATTAKAVEKYGPDALPLLKKSGPAGFEALDKAGAKAPDVIKLFARRGDEAVWLISEPKKLTIFLKHGEPAADALLKYPGIADTLIENYGENVVGALNVLSRKNAQRLSMISEEGLLSKNPRSTELFSVLRLHGDQAMDFIWENKGSLAVAS